MKVSKYYIKTWGCQMNEYDSSRICDLLEQHGLKKVQEPEEADLLILNTCAVREKAAVKLYHQLGRWKELKKNNPKCIFAVGGCVASEEGRTIRSKARNVDIIFGPQTYHRLPEMVSKVEQGLGPQIDVSFPANEKFSYLPQTGLRGPSAFVTIMEGCSNFCSYCIVPYTRGGENSRPVADILDEISQLRDNGTKEINLLGQNVNSFCGLNDDGSQCSFAELLYRVNEIEGIRRIRFTTSNPIKFTPDIITAFGDIPKIANALHLPVQSGSDRILKLMGRPYTADDYRDMVRRLREVRPDISLSSDFIVGFPNESNEDFEETMRLIEDIRFDNSFSFIYSKRPGTPAALMDDEISLEEKKQRLARLQSRINNYALQYSREMFGTKQQVLVEGFSQSGDQLCGKTENNRTVNFSGDKTLIGQMAEIEITDVLPHSLKGKFISII